MPMDKIAAAVTATAGYGQGYVGIIVKKLKTPKQAMQSVQKWRLCFQHLQTAPSNFKGIYATCITYSEENKYL